MTHLALSFCLAVGQAGDLDRAAQALADYAPQEAQRLLEGLRANGPLSYEENVRLHELLGITYSYLALESEALAAFDMLLTLDPGHAISYTLSPKVTFLFEKARRQSEARQPPRLQLSWARGLRVWDPLPITVETVADPKRFFEAGILYSRRRGDAEFSRTALTLRPKGEYTEVVLDAVAPEATGPEVVELYLVAVDPKGSELHRLGTASSPFEVTMTYEEPTAWYARWWIWVTAGAVAAAGAAITTYALTREAPDTISGDFRFE